MLRKGMGHRSFGMLGLKRNTQRVQSHCCARIRAPALALAWALSVLTSSHFDGSAPLLSRKVKAKDTDPHPLLEPVEKFKLFLLGVEYFLSTETHWQGQLIKKIWQENILTPIRTWSRRECERTKNRLDRQSWIFLHKEQRIGRLRQFRCSNWC